MRSIVRRDTGESCQGFLTRLAETSGIKTPTREALARLDRKRKKRTSNTDWTNPHDPNAKVTKMKDGPTHLAHNAEHAAVLANVLALIILVHRRSTGLSAVWRVTVAIRGLVTVRLQQGYRKDQGPRSSSNPSAAATCTTGS
jgi:hypothetical protein